MERIRRPGPAPGAGRRAPGGWRCRPTPGWGCCTPGCGWRRRARRTPSTAKSAAGQRAAPPRGRRRPGRRRRRPAPARGRPGSPGTGSAPASCKRPQDGATRHGHHQAPGQQAGGHAEALPGAGRRASRWRPSWRRKVSPSPAEHGQGQAGQQQPARRDAEEAHPRHLEGVGRGGVVPQGQQEAHQGQQGEEQHRRAADAGRAAPAGPARVRRSRSSRGTRCWSGLARPKAGSRPTNSWRGGGRRMRPRRWTSRRRGWRGRSARWWAGAAGRPCPRPGPRRRRGRPPAQRTSRQRSSGPRRGRAAGATGRSRQRTKKAP